jgi:hypothetical protein
MRTQGHCNYKYKTLMIRRNTRPWWLGGAQEHNNWEEHQHHNKWEEHKTTLQPRGTPMPWQLGEQDHGDEEEHKTTIIKRNTKIGMIKRNTTPRQSWKSQDHGDEEEHKITTLRGRPWWLGRAQNPKELMSRICSNWNAPSFKWLQAWKRTWLETIDTN